MARVDGMLALLLEADFSQRVRCHGEYRSVKRAFSRASARAKLLSTSVSRLGMLFGQELEHRRCCKIPV
jgi:hypothetical protein